MEDTAQLHVLLVDGDADHGALVRAALHGAECSLRITTVPTLRSALEAVQQPSVSCVVTDVRLADAEGVHVVQALRATRPDLPVVVVVGGGSDALAVALLKHGAADYVGKHPGYLSELPTIVRDVLGRAVLAGLDDPDAESGATAPPPVAFEALVATTPNMRAVLALVERAARSAVPVLLEGETGTGKELVAHAVHLRGPRRDAPFLIQNCAAIPESLLESELFGHVRGAFTGAERERRGLFEEAGEGTVFLDEIAETSPAVQAKLLRVVQHDEVKAVGADRPRPVRARIVAATNRPLEAEVRAGRFRADLYYRLAVFPIRVPPLRHRTPDVARLAAHFLARCERRERRETGGIDAEALRALQSYRWPGNVRELENEIHRLVLCLPQGQRIRRHHLARRIRDGGGVHRDVPLERILERVEVAVIRQRLLQQPTKTAAAQSLGITREALYAKMRRLGVIAGAPVTAAPRAAQTELFAADAQASPSGPRRTAAPAGMPRAAFQAAR